MVKNKNKNESKPNMDQKDDSLVYVFQSGDNEGDD